AASLATRAFINIVEYDDKKSSSERATRYAIHQKFERLARIMIIITERVSNEDECGKVQIDARDKSGFTSLHLAMRYDKRDIAETLLKLGADPNAANDGGSTPLHIIALRKKDDDLAEKFFQICDDIRETVQVDARDKWGVTPLQIALRYGNRITAESLLRRGANPNVTSPEGWTPLHFIGLNKVDDDLVEIFFKVTEDNKQEVKVDVANDSGSTPLHVALRYGNKIAAEALLRRGANHNVVNANGWRPLHYIAMQQTVGDDLVKLFFEIIDEQQQQVLIDARDKWGRTPLHDAVASLSPGVVDVLLDRGADLSKFVFPTARYFGEKIKRLHGEQCYEFKFRLGFQALAVVRSLKNRGYRLNSRDALTVMKFFVKHGLFEESAHNDDYCDDDETRMFNVKRRELMISPNLSLYDLTKLGIAEMAKRFTDALQASQSRAKLVAWVASQARPLPTPSCRTIRAQCQSKVVPLTCVHMKFDRRSFVSYTPCRPSACTMHTCIRIAYTVASRKTRCDIPLLTLTPATAPSTPPPPPVERFDFDFSIYVPSHHVELRIILRNNKASLANKSKAEDELFLKCRARGRYYYCLGARSSLFHHGRRASWLCTFSRIDDDDEDDESARAPPDYATTTTTIRRRPAAMSSSSYTTYKIYLHTLVYISTLAAAAAIAFARIVIIINLSEFKKRKQFRTTRAAAAAPRLRMCLSVLFI
ncbi:unnamed protein product, partial [Trichogramma brassicae]